MWLNRKKSNIIKSLFISRPAILVTGARQVGKSSLLQHLFPNADLVSLDHIVKAAAAEQNPEAFLASLRTPALLDEIQYAPGLFRELKVIIDRDRQRYGNWLLTGSQKFALMKNVSESLAGRVGIIELETLCAEELRPHKSVLPIDDLPWKGGYPELWAQPEINFANFFESYVQTYLERDLKEIIEVRNLRDFQRFLKAISTRTGQLINYADIAKDVGVTQVTIKSWLGALESSGIVYLLSPYYRNMGRRLIKAPKLYFADQGLLSHLLDIEDRQDYERHIYRDHIWENFVFTELLKSHDLIPNKNLFYFRDTNGVEIDFVVEKKAKVTLIEVKNSERFDEKKLNFKKVAPLFDREVTCLVACRVQENRLISLKDFGLFHPLKCEDLQIS